jgi:hypothetical protein
MGEQRRGRMKFNLIKNKLFNILRIKKDEDFPENDSISNSYRLAETKMFEIEAPEGYEVMINGKRPKDNHEKYYDLKQGDVVTISLKPNIHIKEDGWYEINA